MRRLEEIRHLRIQGVGQGYQGRDARSPSAALNALKESKVHVGKLGELLLKAKPEAVPVR